MDEHATALADAIVAALPRWVEGSVERILVAAHGQAEPAALADAAEAGRRAAGEVGRQVRALLEADIDEQRTTPLALLRAAVRYPAGVLAAHGVSPVDRDPAQAALFPDDIYDLAPANLGDVDPALAELGLAWGASKAWRHMQRHRARPEARS